MELYLGIDGGQSSTVVLIGGADGRVIGSGRGGPCNHVSARDAASKLKRVISGCIAQACENAGLDPETVDFAGACCGMSGGPDDKKSLLSEVIKTRRLVVKTDGEIALTGAMNGAPGIAVIAGTGSIAFGRNREGRLLRAGGWGYVYGDEGGAFDIARQAVRACLRYEEGWGIKTALHAALFEVTGVRSAADLVHVLYTVDWPRSRVATLSELVDTVSAGGDFVARTILEQAGQSLASLATCLRVQLFLESEMTQVAFVGGVFHSRVVLERFRMLVELADGCTCIAPAFDPAAGALLEAYAANGHSIQLSNVPVLKYRSEANC